MVSSGLGRNDTAYRKAALQLRREAPPICWLCGRDIDRDLPRTDRWSWTADHDPDIATLLRLGLDPSSIDHLRPAHRRCNSIKQDRPAKPPPNCSRSW